MYYLYPMNLEHYNQSFDELVVLPSGGNKSMKVQQDTEIMEIALMGIYPNPADKEVFFTFSYLQDVTNAVLSIYDANGRLMDKIDLAKYQGIYRLDITDWATGIYYSKLEVQGKVIADKKFTKL